MRAAVLVFLLAVASAADPAFTLVIDTTKLGSAANQFVLPLNAAYTTYNFNVDWGDGGAAQTVTKGTAGFPAVGHTYAAPGRYTVKIIQNAPNGFPAIKFNNAGDCRKLIQIANWGDVEWASMNAAFSGCYNVTITATDEATANTGNVTDFSYAWYGCSGLTSFPLINTAAGTDFSSAWSGCGSLTSFPLINTSAGTRFDYAWYDCNDLTSFPLIDTSSATSLKSTWQNCTGLTSFPLLDTSFATSFDSTWNYCWRLTSFPLINTAAGTDFSSAWSGCGSLTSFPLIITAGGTRFDYAWYDCNDLTSFPPIDTSSATSLKSTWQYCTGLTNFPLLDTSSVTSFDSTWYYCSRLTNFPTLDLGKMLTGSYCFYGVTLTRRSYSELLINLAATNLNTGVSFHGGGSAYYPSAASARNDTLVTARKWNITDGGSPAPTITNVSPNHGPLSNGPQVTITGTGLGEATSVAFGGIPVTAMISDSDTAITCFPPNHTYGPVDIVVNATAGNVTAPSAYTYLRQPLDSDPALWLVVDTTKPGSADNQFALPLNGNYTTYNFNLDWGDGGTVQTVTNATTGFPSIRHIYANRGVYTIKITQNIPNGFPAIRFNNSGDRLKLIQIAHWGDIVWSSMNAAFYGCSNLKITATDHASAALGNLTDFSYAWNGCIGLTGFPLINTAAGTDFSFAWKDCSSLVEFPLINTAAGTKFESAWSGCSGLTTFPLINTSTGTNFRYAWNASGNLTTFPLIDTSSGTDFSSAWRDCSNLTSFPLINTAAGTRFDSAWSGCRGLTTFPLINTSAGTSFRYSWNLCQNLSNFPLINTAAGTDFSYAWYDCRNLTSFPLIDTAAGTTFDHTWYYCSGLADFPQLNTAAVTYFGSTWEGCSALTHFPLIDTSSATSLDHAWYRCGSLTSFPLINTAKVWDFRYTWYGCSNLTSFPSLNTSAVIDFSGAWCGCSGLTSFPMLDTAKGLKFRYTWCACSGLTNFPLLNTATGWEFGYTWYDCNRLTSFPLINIAAGTNFEYTWHGCSGLTDFPLLDTGAGTRFFSTWEGCSGLTSFPLIDTSSGTRFGWAWAGCSGLTSFPLINLSKMVNGTECFEGVTLTPSSYSALLNNLAATNRSTGVSFYGGASRYYASAASARNATLVVGQGWYIEDGGQVAAMTITNISPSSGPITGGPPVTIAGTGFDEVTSVTFGGNPATEVITRNGTLIICRPPPGALGPVDIIVNTPVETATASGAYTYLEAQEIRGFVAFDPHTYGDPAITITGVTGGGSGEAVVFTSGNTNVATISGTTVTVVGAGSTVITATQAGNAEYAAAPPVQQTLVVARAALNVTAIDASRTIGIANPIFTGTINGVVNDDQITVTYASSATSTTPVGVYGPATPEAITPTLVDPNSRLANYTITVSKGTLTINPVLQVIRGFATFGPRTYGNPAFPIIGVTGGASGQPVIFASTNTQVATVSGTTVTIVGAGSAAITATQAGNAMFAAAPSVQQTLVVAPAPLVVSATDASRVIGNANPLFTGTIIGVVNGDPITATYASTATAATALGVYGPTTSEAITPTLVDPGSRLAHYTVTVSKGTLTITDPLPQEIQGFAGFSAKTYGNPSFPITGVSGGASDQAVVFTSGNTSVATISGTTVTIIGAGSTVITATQAGNATYAAAPSVQQTLVVARASLNVTASSASRAIGAANPAFTGTLTGVVNGDPITATYASSATATTAVCQQCDGNHGGGRLWPSHRGSDHANLGGSQCPTGALPGHHVEGNFNHHRCACRILRRKVEPVWIGRWIGCLGCLARSHAPPCGWS